MNSKHQFLPLLFDRPREPIFMLKGPQKVLFLVKEYFVPDRYKHKANEIIEANSRKASIVCRVIDIEPLDLTEIAKIRRDEKFNVFLKDHITAAAKLTQIFMDAPDIDILIARGVYARDRINTLLFNYCWTTTLLHHTITEKFRVRPLVLVFPQLFFSGSVINKAKMYTYFTPKIIKVDLHIPVELTGPASDPEHRLAYFREDLGLSLHHWHWHLIYPSFGGESIVDKDRRGELFYYMHRQLIARYNFERFCNGFHREKPLAHFWETLVQGYYSKLEEYPGRPDDTKLSDIDRPEGRFDLNDMKRYHERIYSAIHEGYYIESSGKKVKFDDYTGIDVLANIIESSQLSPNEEYYGNLHDLGHLLISTAHDPKYKHKEPAGVLSNNATTIRDPAFYKWHTYIDDIFQEYKRTLPSYPLSELEYKGISIERVSVNETNVLYTHWVKRDVNINYGLDFYPTVPTHVRFRHLDHKPFTYTISVTNEEELRFGTCRIFLAPKLNDFGKVWSFDEQRLMMIELDRFIVALNKGQNIIKRHSHKSSVTIPANVIYADYETITDPENSYCTCGWPQYLLLPKGTNEGFPCELFVMISNYNDDAVMSKGIFCTDDSSSYCGVDGGMYPDRRPMGFPFDRPSRYSETLREFLKDNMFVQDVLIQFMNDDL